MSELDRLERTTAPLVARARNGDADAFADLLRVVRPWIYRWSVVDLGDSDEAEDVTQDVLVRLHTKLDRFRPENRFTTWLFRITRNAAADRRRGWQRRLRLRFAGEASMSQNAHNRSSPEAAALRVEAEEIVQRFLTVLPSRQRQVLDLVDLQGFSPADVAGMLGLDPGTVRTHLHRARRDLRARILASVPEFAQGRGA